MARILVVDDEPRICRFVCRALERDGHSVATAGTGPDAIHLVTTGDYALIVLDLVLPGLGGLDVLRRLRTEMPGLRVLVLSAVGDVAAKVECFENGAVDYLAKPFAVAELVARVRLRAGEPATGTLRRWLSVGALSLDLHRRTATLHDRHVELSQREFVLLSYLMQRPGQVCRREDLLAGVWGYTFDTSSNVLEVYVRRLRAKLDSGWIETVRNVGYCFNAS